MDLLTRAEQTNCCLFGCTESVNMVIRIQADVHSFCDCPEPEGGRRGRIILLIYFCQGTDCITNTTVKIAGSTKEL